MSTLVHIKKIEMAKSEGNISPVTVHGHDCLLSNALSFEEINIYELVGVQIEDAYENNQRQFTTTATFKTCDKLPSSIRRSIFRLTSIDGTTYIIGTGGIPHPVLTEKNPYPEKPADTTMKTVNITWKAPFPMLRVIK